MFAFLLPSGLLNELDKIIGCFWWGHDVDKRKIHLISWDKIARPKSQGGLGVRDFECMNLALLAKAGLENSDSTEFSGF